MQNSERSTCYKTVQRKQMKIDTSLRHQIQRACFNKGAAREIYTRQAENANGKACFRKFRAQQSLQEISQNQWRKAEKAVLPRRLPKGVLIIFTSTWEPGRPNLLPWNKPSSKRNGRELAMDGPKYTWKKLKKALKSSNINTRPIPLFIEEVEAEEKCVARTVSIARALKYPYLSLVLQKQKTRKER